MPPSTMTIALPADRVDDLGQHLDGAAAYVELAPAWFET